jgi:hypothetical protein
MCLRRGGILENASGGIMKRKFFHLFSFISLIFMLSCANPEFVMQSEKFTPNDWNQIAILPFSGNPAFTKMASDTFALHMLKQQHFKIVQPSTVEVSLRQIRVASSPSELSIQEAQKVGQIVNAEAVFIGDITSYNNGFTLNAFATVKLVDTKTGEIVAASHKPSGLLFGYSEHQAAIAAVKNVANEMLLILEELSKKNVITPTKTKMMEQKQGI